MNGPDSGKGDVVFALAIIAFSALIYWQSLGLPPPRYEPMGSAALPKALSVIMSVLALFVLARAIRRIIKAEDKRVAPQDDTPRPGERVSEPSVLVTGRPGLAVMTFVATVVYVAVLDMKVIGYPIATVVYLSLTCLGLSHLDWRQLRWIAPFAVGLSLICYFVFTRVFYIDLP